MLGSIKFLTWSFILKTSYCILSTLKLTARYLICNCQISSISVFFRYFKFYVVWISLLPFYHLLGCFSTWGTIFHFSFIFRHVRTNQVSQMNTCYLSHKGNPTKWKISKIEVSKNSVSKNRCCIFYCF